MNLAKLLTIHAALTFAAGVLLIVKPDLIPSTVGVHVDRSAHLVCYLLGAAELALAFLSFWSRKFRDAQVLRLVSVTFIVFHASTALVEVYAFSLGVSASIWINVALRVAVVILFAYYGLHKADEILDSSSG
jgi:hypothetical protein